MNTVQSLLFAIVGVIVVIALVATGNLVIAVIGFLVYIFGARAVWLQMSKRK